LSSIRLSTFEPLHIYVHTYLLTDFKTQDVAKDGNASLNTRATAAKDMVGDKVDEKKHKVRSFARPPLLSHTTGSLTISRPPLQTNANLYKNKNDL